MAYKLRIKEVVFKNGDRQFYPQINFTENPKDDDMGWDYLRVIPFNKSVIEVRKNDYMAACDSEADALKVMMNYKIGRQKLEESWAKSMAEDAERENSIQEIIITNINEI